MPFDPALPFEEVEDEFETLSIEPKIKPSVSGFDPTQPFEEVESPEEQGIIRQVADIPLGIARGGVTGIKMMTDILGADNPVSKSLSGVEGYMADLMSAQAKEDQQEISRIMKDAEDKGFGEQVKAGIKAFSIAPVDIMSQALGTMAPVIATGLAGSAAKLGALGMRAVQAGVGAGMGAGMIKGEIYNEVKNELVNSGIAEDAAEKAAVEAQSYGGKNLDQILLGAGLGAASTLGAEGIITRILTKQGTAPAAGVVSRVLKGGLTEAAPEAAQAAQEQLAKNVALQREGFDVDPSRGVVAAATMEAVAAAPLGGIAGAVERPAPIKTLAEENLEQTNEIARKVAENGAPLTASAIQDQAATNLRQDELAKQLEAQLEEELVAVKEPTAAPPAIKSKEEFTAIYSQVAPEELDAAEAGFTNTLATAATEEARANAQNALEAIKEVKATVTPPAPTVAPTITPAVTPAVPTAQPPITDATQEIIQPEGVRPELETGVEVPTPQAGVGDSILGAARGQEEGQVVPTAEAPSAPTIKGSFEDMGAGVVGNLYDMMFGKLQVGDTTELGQPSRVLAEAMPAYQAGIIKDAKDLRNWVQGDVKLREAFEKTKAAPTGVAAPEPIISEIPPTSELVGAEPTQPTIREVPEISPIVGEEPSAIVEQESSKVYDETQTRIRGIQAPPAGGEIVLEPEPLANQGGITKQEKQVGRGAGDREKQRGDAGVAGQALPRTIPELTEDQAETLRDFISLRKSQGREPNPEQVKRLAEYDARNAGVEVQQGDIVSNIVVGHPLFEAPQPELQNLVPIKVQNKEQLASSIQRTENVRNAAQTYIGQYQADQAKAKTAAQKKAFAKKFNKSEFDRQRDILDYINNDVMPELDRMEKAAPSAPATTPVTTPPVTEAITPTPEAAPTPAGISVGNRVKSGRDPKVYVVEEVLPQTEAEQREGDYSVMLRDEKSGKIDRYPFSIRGLKKIGEKKIRKTEVAPITEPAGVTARKPATLPTIPSIEEQTAEIVYGGQTGLYDPFSGVQRKRVKAEDSAGRKGDEAQIKNADQHAAEIGGTVLYQDGDISLIRGYSIWGGNPVYIVANKDSRSKTDISSYTGKLVTPEQRSQLIDIKNKIEAQDQASFDNKPFITFTDGVAFSNGVPSTIAGVLSGWKSLLNIKSNLYVTTYNDAVTDKDKFNGPHRVIGSAGLASSKTDGSIRRMPNGDFYIMFREIPSKTKMLETLAHELGHLHEKEAFENASAATKQMLREEHSKWVKSQTGKTAKELVSSLRPVKAAKANLGAAEGMMADELSPYWKSFGEWYADQVSRWAVSSDKPLTIVDRFFSRIAKALKSFYLNITNQGYLPNETFVKYLEKTLNEPSRIVSEQITTDQEFEQLSQQLGGQEETAEPEPKRRKEQVGGAEREETRYITTPKGILSMNTDVLREKFFDGTSVSPEKTTQAWGYISRLLDIKSGNANEFAGEINDTVIAELEARRDAAIAAGEDVDPDENLEERIGAAMFSVELMNYAGKLAEQGDQRMLKFMIRNVNSMPVDKYAGGISDLAIGLRTRLEYDVSGFGAYSADQKGKVERTAAVMFGTNKPNEDQFNTVKDALDKSEKTELGNPEEVAGDIENVEKRTGRSVVKKIEEKIKASTAPKKEELLISFQNLNQDRKFAGINITYKPQKIDPAKNIQNLIIGKLVDYRKTLVNQGADGLESTFWQTMSSKERKPGPLGELDQAQNNELAKIVQKTLIDLGLKGKPPNTKMTDIEKVAAILNEQRLSEEKKVAADKKIVEEIERRRSGELEGGGDSDAVNAKYDAILNAWNEAMSRQTNMPISDNMLQRLINSELKEQGSSVTELINEPYEDVLSQKKKGIVDSIIRRVYGVSKEAETGIEISEDYDNLSRYLKQTLENMLKLQAEKRDAAVARTLQRGLGDLPALPEVQKNKAQTIVQQDLRQQPDMGRREPWQNMLVGKLTQAGVDPEQAENIANLVWRQHEINDANRKIKEMKTAAEKGSLAVIIDRIKNTSLEKQQSPEWKQEVIKEYLRDAGLSSQAAETAAKLYDSIISERLAAAKQKAFEDTLAKAAPWKNYASRNGKLAKDALKKIKEAIRAGVLDPEKNAESIIAALNGWTGFTKEQYQRIVQIDTILNDPNKDDVTKREAMDELNRIISKAKLPVSAREAIGPYYVGQALGGIPTATVNVASPLGFSIRNLMVDISKYAATDPAKIPIAFESFLDSMRSWYNQTAYAYKNQIYLNDVVEYLNGQNVLRELFDKGKQQWAEGKYAEGLKNMAIGMMQITGRVLSALDQGAISMLENQNITRYAMAALENAKDKVPKNKIREFANMTLDLKRRVITENIAAGMDKNRAVVLADLAVKSEIRAALSEFGVSYKDVLDSAVNDALQSVGRNKVITIEGVKKVQQDISDSGFLSYPPIKFLEWIASSAGQGGPAMQIFSKMVYGFALIPARTFSTAAWFSPYGFLRLAIDKYNKNKGQESPYAMSLQTEAQFKQRLTDSIAGSIVMLALFAMRSGSSDDEDDKLFKIVITGNGPNATTDKQYYDTWIKNHKPYSIELHFGDSKATINIGRGGEALFFPIMLAGALDDWEIKKKQNLTKKEPSDLNIATELLGSAFFALAQRGPYAAFTEPLFDASKQGRVTENLVGQLGYFGKTFIPVLGTSITRNISDFINDPVDRSSIEGALYANTPIVGPWIGTKALNALGQPIRADDFSDKLFKLGVPVVFSFPKNTPENALNELILKQGSGPTIPTRSNAQKRFGDVLTDKEFETYVREYGRVMSDKMFKSRTKLANMKPADYDDELEKYARGYSIDGIKIKGASDSAVLAVKRMRQ